MHARQFYDPVNQKYEQELEFALKLRHWASESANPVPQDKSDRFKGRELYSKLRRFVADALSAPRNPSCQPIDHDTDPKAAEAALFPVEHVVKTPQYGFDVYLERAVWSAVAARRGWLLAEWDARINDIVFRNADPRRCFRCPGYRDVWDRTLPWFIEQVPMRVVEARERFEDLDLRADFSGSDLNNSFGRNDTTNTLSADPQANPDDEGQCLALLCWSQFDGETREEVVGKRPVEQPYAYCASCGHKNAPEVAGLACPECARQTGQFSELQLAQSEDFVADLPRYPGGRVLEVVFPLQGKCRRGPWPTGPEGEQLRMPPYMELRRSEHPTEDCGLSDTAADAPMQTLSNQLMERMRRQVQGPGTTIAVSGAPEDADGNPWQANDDPIQFIHFPDPTTSASVKVIQLADVSPALFNAIQMVQEQFRSDLGTFELSAQSAQDVKGVAVGTVEKAEKSGSVPTDHFVQRMHYALACFYGVISDWLRIGWTEARWVRYKGRLGAAQWKLTKGADIPNADFVFGIGSAKDFADSRIFDAAMKWYSTGLPQNGGSPALRRALAAAGVAPISMELVDDIDEAEAEQTEQMAEQQAGAPGEGQGPDAGAPGDAGQDLYGPEAGDPAGDGMAPDDLAALMGARGMA